MTKAIVFDLDNTLFDTRSIPSTLTDELFGAMRAANSGVDAIPETVLESALDDSWSMPFPVVAARYGLPSRLVDVWAEQHRTLTFVEPLHPYSDVVDTLQSIRIFKCLLTSGYRHVQLKKIAALGIGSLFDLILIDAVDDQVHRGKAKFLAELLAAHDWKPADVLIVGDSAASEIAAGVQLGIPTVQILRPGVIRTTTADRHISSLVELLQFPIG